MSTLLDSLHERGRVALLGGQPHLDVPPGEGSRRWGVSVLVRPQPDLAQRLHAVTGDLTALAGPGQWATGAADSVHLSVYSLEPHRPGVTLEDAEVARYADAVHRAAGSLPPVSFAVTGLALTPGGVVAACDPLDAGARGLRAAVNDALGEEAFETAYRGASWWMSLVHLASPVRDAAGLVEHVEARRRSPLGTLRAGALQLVRYEHRRVADEQRMVPVVLSEARIARSEEVLGGAHA